MQPAPGVGGSFDAPTAAGGTASSTGGSVVGAGAGAATGGASTGGAASGGASSGGGDNGSMSNLPSGTELFHATFETRSEGNYTQDLIAGDFGSDGGWNNGLDEGRATIVDDAGNKVLRVTYPANGFGPSTAGVQFKVPFGASYDEVYLSYRVRFASGFDFVKGGKLPGLIGGSAPTGCKPSEDGFSARNMWRREGLPVQYIYHPDQPSTCGEDYDYQVGGADAAFSPGTWHLVEHRIVMNDPGSSNGVMQAWFDGVLAVDVQDFVWRKTSDFAIDSLYFSTFFGGGDDSWAPMAAQIVDFDDLRVVVP